MDFNFFNSEDLPPEVAEMFQNLRHQSDMNEMAQQDATHRIQDFINRQSTDDLLIVRRLLLDAGSSSHRASNMIGYINGILSAHHEVCLCGNIHSAENVSE